MNKHYLMAMASVVLGSATLNAETREGFFDGGWRISAGAVYSSPVKANMRMTPWSLRRASRVTTGTGLSAEEAQSRAENGTYNPDTGRTEYENGAWFAPDDGGNPDQTWNAYIPSGSYLSGRRQFSLGEVMYGESVFEYAPDSIPGSYGACSDSSSMPGINIELSRELYRNEEYSYGLDLAFGLMYFFETDVYKADYGYRAGRENESSGGGTYEGVIDAPDPLENPNDWYWNENGSYGRGGIDTFNNGGPVFDLDSITSIHHPGAGSSTSSRDCFGSMHARGDYRELDLVLSLRPYYDLADWLRLYGTIGAVLSRDALEMDMVLLDNGLAFRRSVDYSQWNLYGIAGLGAMLRYKDFTLGGDFLARFGDDDLTVNEPCLQGTVEHGRWLFKLTLGYEF